MQICPKQAGPNGVEQFIELSDIDFSNVDPLDLANIYGIQYTGGCRPRSLVELGGVGPVAPLCIDITRAGALALIASSSLNPCTFYRITDRGNIILRAWSANRMERHGNADAPANPFTTNELVFMIYDIVTDLVSYIRDMRGNEYVYNLLSFGGVNALLTLAQYGNPNIYQNKYNQTNIDYSGLLTTGTPGRVRYNTFGTGSITLSDNIWLFNSNVNSDYSLFMQNNAIIYASDIISTSLTITNDAVIQNSRLASSDVVLGNNEQFIGCTIENQKTNMLTFNTGITHNSKAIYPGLSTFEIDVDMTGGTQLDMTNYLWAGIVNVTNNDVVPTLDTVVFNNENHDLTFRMATGTPLAVNIVAVATALSNELVYNSAGVLTLNGGNGDELILFRKFSNSFNYIRSLQNFG